MYKFIGVISNFKDTFDIWVVVVGFCCSIWFSGLKRVFLYLLFMSTFYLLRHFVINGAMVFKYNPSVFLKPYPTVCLKK